MHGDTRNALTPSQCRAARGLLGWTQENLARQSAVAKKTIADFERGAPRRQQPRTLADLRASFERAGLEFIDEDEGGEGLRFRQRRDERQPAAQGTGGQG